MSYTKEDMKSFADWCRNGLTNIEYSYLKLDEHLEKWQFLKQETAEKECKCIRFVGSDNWYSNGCEIHPEEK